MRIRAIFPPGSSFARPAFGRLGRPHFTFDALRLRPLAILAAFILIASLFPRAFTLAAQSSPAPQQAANPAMKPAHSHKKPAASTPTPQPTPEPVPPAPAPVVPPPPDWPANDHPVAASVVWDSHGLSVVATNSSLTQILKEISLDTGIKVEGITKDERVFGAYGPAPARDVLAQLLDGSNYDVLMVGELGQGTPRRVVLTARSGGATPAGNANPGQPADQDSGADEGEQQSEEAPPEQPQPQPQQAQPPPNGFAPGVPYRTQQQLIEEMQERQRQFQQQQQQQQQQNPQN